MREITPSAAPLSAIGAPRTVAGSALVAIAAVSAPARSVTIVVTALSAAVLVRLVFAEIRSALLHG